MPYSKEKLQRFFEVYTVHPLLDTAVQLLYKSWIITILDFCNVCQAEEIISFEVPLYEKMETEGYGYLLYLFEK